MITLLVVAGIAILIAIGYMNHVVENNKLEKARTKVELNDRLRRCGELTETFPGQFMTPALKLLLTRLELNVCQRLLNLEKTSAATKARIAELNALTNMRRLGIDRDAPFQNQLLHFQARAKAGLGQDLVQLRAFGLGRQHALGQLKRNIRLVGIKLAGDHVFKTVSLNRLARFCPAPG